MIADQDGYVTRLLRTHAMSGGEDVLAGEDRAAAVVAFRFQVDQACHGRVLVDAGLVAAHDSRLGTIKK